MNTRKFFVFLTIFTLLLSGIFSSVVHAADNERSDIAVPSESMACISVSPTYLEAGETGDIVIIGMNTSFDATSTATGCSGVTVGTVTVTSITELTVTLTARDVTSDTDCDLTVTTGTEGITCAGQFEIIAEDCAITAAPESLNSGWFFPRLAVVTVNGNASCENFTFETAGVDYSERLIPILSIPLYKTLFVPTIIWPGTEDVTVDVTVGDDVITTIDVIAGILP